METVALHPSVVAQSAFRALHAALGTTVMWDMLDVNERIAWMAFATHAEPTLELVDDKPVEFKAGAIYRKLRDSQKIAPVEWKDLSAREKLAWQAMTRHLYYLLDSEEHDQMLEVEASWGPWVEKRLKGSS